MFEPKSPNPNQPNFSPPSPPLNLPTGQPPRPTPVQKEPEDILSVIDQVNPAVKGPATTAPFFGLATPPAVKAAEKPVSKEPFSFFKRNKKVVVASFLVLLLAVVLAAAGWYAYNLFGGGLSVNPPAVNLGNQPQDEPALPDVNQPAAEPVAEPAVNENVNVNQPPPPPPDTDRDGLTDDEEAMYGTDPNKIDTDNDDLTDRDEVKVFKTDPNNPDTDGDSYKDGEEIRNGYDPKGPGRLLEIN